MRVHIVQKGDTLWKIAKQYAIGFEELKRLNAHLANPDYIVPGMEIYLPDSAQKKETKHMVKEQPKPVKEQPIKEQPIQGPAPTPMPMPMPAPMPVPVPMPQPQKPIWQGDIYFQTPQQPMPLPNWQTNVHVQPSFENTNTMVPPAQQQPVFIPQMMPQQPIIMQQPPQQPIIMQQPPQQPIFIEHQPHFIQPMMHHHHMPICPKCHRMTMEESVQMQPMLPEESSSKKYHHLDMMHQVPHCPDRGHHDMHCPDREHQVRHYYEEIEHMMRQQNPCCHPQMMPYMHMPHMQMPHMQMMPQTQMPYMQMPQMSPMHMPQMSPMQMPQMQEMPHPPKSCH